MTDKFLFTVSIPCSRHVRKYLIGRYGETHTMSKTSLLGTILFHLLDKDCPKASVKIADFDSRYDILIPNRYSNQRGYHIGTKKRQYLALCLERIFFEDLLQSIELASKKYETKPIQAMRDFLNLYEITEMDVNFESIYRKYQREKSSKKAA